MKKTLSLCALLALSLGSCVRHSEPGPIVDLTVEQEVEIDFDEMAAEVAEEAEGVPWVLYHYRRRIDFYETFCLAARRRGPAGEL